MKKITGLKKAVGDYNRANQGGAYSSEYGYLMFNKETGEIWTDEFCSLGHNAWKDYQSDSIINLSNMMIERGIDVNMSSVKQFVLDTFDGFDN